MKKTIAFLGAGNMGSAIISALLEKEIITSDQLFVADKSAEKLATFAAQGAHVSENAEEILSNAAFVFLAVKPQDAGDLLTLLSGSFDPDATLISIAASLNVDFLKEKSGLQKIIRVMPNTPAMVHMGVSEVYISPEVSDEEKEYVRTLLQSFSTVFECESEDQLDNYGTISGCGPAYFFRILEIFAKRAEKFGLSPNEAKQLALQTMRGSGELAHTSPDSLSTLREKVTSKGGITAEALKVFEEQDLEETLNAGIDAAIKRTKELGK